MVLQLFEDCCILKVKFGKEVKPDDTMGVVVAMMVIYARLKGNKKISLRVIMELTLLITVGELIIKYKILSGNCFLVMQRRYRQLYSLI